MNIQKTTYKPLPILENHRCFACGHMNPSGLGMEFFTDDESVCSHVEIPEHLRGWDRLVHGGVISLILDEIMSWSAICLLKKIVLTKSIAVSFEKPIHIGTAIRAEGRILERRGEREALVEGTIRLGNGETAARSEGIFALLSVSAAKRLKVVDERALKEIAPLLESSSHGHGIK